MPSRLKTPCRHPGCPQLVRGAYCEEHRREAYRRPADQRRGTAAQRGYDRRWQRLRAWYIARNPLCEDCLDEGVVNATDLDVDHVIPIHVRPDLRLDPANLRTRCRRHHQRKTREDQRKYG